jgi:hypothetical protein
MTVRPGQPWRPPRATDANAQGSAGEHYRRNVAMGQSQRPAFTSQHPLKIKNLTGGTLDRGSVVKLGDAVLDSLSAEYLWFAGEEPDSGDATRVAVLLSPAGENKIVNVAMVGVCLAIVDVTNTGHRFCSPVNGESHFVSGSTGELPIINQPTSTGEQLCAVNLDRRGGSSLKRHALTPSGGIAAATISGGSITPGYSACSVYAWNGSVYSASGTEVIYNPYPDTIQGNRVIAYSPDADGLPTIDVEACRSFPS